jgi:hypothetical protein
VNRGYIEIYTHMFAGAFYAFPDVSSYYGKTTNEGAVITNRYIRNRELMIFADADIC